MWIGSKIGAERGMSAPAPAVLPMDLIRRKGASGMYQQQRQDLVPHRALPHSTESRRCHLHGYAFQERPMHRSPDTDCTTALEHYSLNAAKSNEPATSPIMIDGKALQKYPGIRRRSLWPCCRKRHPGNRLVHPKSLPHPKLLDAEALTNDRFPQTESEFD